MATGMLGSFIYLHNDLLIDIRSRAKSRGLFSKRHQAGRKRQRPWRRGLPTRSSLRNIVRAMR